MSSCKDCGCTLNDGICSNCHEELYIIENQSEYIDYPLPDEFLKKAEEQREAVKENRKKEAGNENGSNI